MRELKAHNSDESDTEASAHLHGMHNAVVLEDNDPDDGTDVTSVHARLLPTLSSSQ